MSNNKLFNKLIAEETNFLNSHFISPVIRNHSVRVKIAGVVVCLSIVRPKRFEGFGVFTPLTYKTAVLVRLPSLREKQEYLNLFPSLHLIPCRCMDGLWYGIPLHTADTRFRIEGMVPIYLSKEVQMFDIVQVRYDGQLCWFEGISSKKSGRSAVQLREELSKETEPEKISFSGMVQQEREAYQIAYNDIIENKRDRTEERIKQAVEHGGGKYRSYIEREDTFTIEFVVGRETHKSVVRKHDLQIQSAGICLSGTDAQFDIQSLVGVVKLGQERGAIVRVEDNRYVDRR